jgi:hypothetical protein
VNYDINRSEWNGFRSSCAVNAVESPHPPRLRSDLTTLRNRRAGSLAQGSDRHASADTADAIGPCPETRRTSSSEEPLQRRIRSGSRSSAIRHRPSDVGHRLPGLSWPGPCTIDHCPQGGTA